MDSVSATVAKEEEPTQKTTNMATTEEPKNTTTDKPPKKKNTRTQQHSNWHRGRFGNHTGVIRKPHAQRPWNASPFLHPADRHWGGPPPRHGSASPAGGRRGSRGNTNNP